MDLLFASKMTRPLPPAIFVDRPRLYHELDRWQSMRAVVIHAAAGYGKSMLVSRWLEVSGAAAQAVWLALDATDCDPAQFVRYVAAALEPVVPGVLAQVQPILKDHQSNHPQRALAHLFTAIHERSTVNGNGVPRHWLLVLEDVHLVCSPAIDALIMTMLERSPANLHLVLLARQATTLPLARLYARGQLLELTADDLRFTADEVREYLVDHQFAPPTASELAQIVARTEGWVVALQLATLSLRQRGNLPTLLDALRGDKRWLAQYLTNEILAQQTPALQRFLLQTSILDSFDALLCEAVTGLADAYRLLAESERAGLFLIALDGSHAWFRYHHLFQELLQHRLLELEGTEGSNVLHRRAARWLAAAERLPDAVRHLLAAGDDAAAAALVAERFHAILLYDPYQAVRLLALLPNEVISCHPQLALNRCRLAVLFNSAEFRQYVFEAVRVMRRASPGDPRMPVWQAELLVLRAIAHLRQGELAAASALAEQARRCTGDLDDFMLGTLEFLLVHLQQQQGQLAAVEQHAQRALAAFSAADFLSGAIALRRELAQYAVRAGHAGAAAQQFEAIFAVQDRERPMVMREMLMAYLYAAENSYWLNQLDQAQAYQQAALALATRLQDDEIIVGLACLGQLYAHAAAPFSASGPAHGAPPPHLTTHFPIVFADVQIRLLVALGHTDAAWRVAQGLSLKVGGQPEQWHQAALLPYLCAGVARGKDLAAVTPVLGQALAYRTKIEDRFTQLRLLALVAWQQVQLSDMDAATHTLAQAARLAQETGYVRVLLDIPRLTQLSSTIDDPAVRATFGRHAGATGSSEEFELTDQEQAVLALLVTYRSYQKIATELVVSINTVRTHVRHLYQKLDVHGRAEALTRAQSLGLHCVGAGVHLTNRQRN